MCRIVMIMGLMGLSILGGSLVGIWLETRVGLVWALVGTGLTCLVLSLGGVFLLPRA